MIKKVHSILPHHQIPTQMCGISQQQRNIIQLQRLAAPRRQPLPPDVHGQRSRPSIILQIPRTMVEEDTMEIATMTTLCSVAHRSLVQPLDIQQNVRRADLPMMDFSPVSRMFFRATLESLSAQPWVIGVEVQVAEVVSGASSAATRVLWLRTKITEADCLTRTRARDQQTTTTHIPWLAMVRPNHRRQRRHLQLKHHMATSGGSFLKGNNNCCHLHTPSYNLKLLKYLRLRVTRNAKES